MVPYLGKYSQIMVLSILLGINSQIGVHPRLWPRPVHPYEHLPQTIALPRPSTKFDCTVATVASKHLAIVIIDNGVYQITGWQPILTSHGTGLVAIAKRSGLAQSAWAADEAHFEALMDQALQDDGPQFIAARTDASLPAEVTERDAAKIRGRFMEGLGIRG